MYAPHSFLDHTSDIRESITILEPWKLVSAYHSVDFILGPFLDVRILHHACYEEAHRVPCLEQVDVMYEAIDNVNVVLAYCLHSTYVISIRVSTSMYDSDKGFHLQPSAKRPVLATYEYLRCPGLFPL